MTQTEKSSRKVISGAGWVNPLTHDFRVDLAAEVHVFAVDVDGVSTELVGGVDYTVSNVANDAGYVVTITNAGAWAPAEWVLDARPAIDQGSNLSLGGQFGAAYEDAIDKLTRRVQRVYDLARRAVKTSASDAVGGADVILPEPQNGSVLGWLGGLLTNVSLAALTAAFPATANRYVRNNASGFPDVVSSAQTATLDALSNVTTQAYGRSLLTLASAAVLKAGLGVPYINVVSDYGAVADVVQTTGNVTIGNGSNALTLVGANFTAADVGKSIFVPGAGAAGAMLATKITGFTDATHVTLQTNASTALAAVSKTVNRWTDQSAAFQAAINAAVAVKGTVYVPSGNYGFDGANAGSLDPGAGGIGFLGETGTTLFYFEGEAGSKRYLFKNTISTAKGSLLFQNTGFQGTLDAYERRAGNPLWLDFYDNITIDKCRWYSIAAETMDLHYNGSVFITNNRILSTAADGIRCRDTPNVLISGNYLQRTGDDAIAAHTSNVLTTGSREGVFVTNNHCVNTGCIRVLSPRTVVISGNRMELPRGSALNIGSPVISEGTLPFRDVIIEDNIVLDQLDVVGGVPSSSTANSIVFSANPAVGQASTNNTRPGRYNTTGAAWVFPWTYDEVDTSSGAAVVPPTTSLRISGNILRRSRPAAASFSAYGFGTICDQGVSRDPAISDANMRAGCSIVAFTGSFQQVMITDNICESAQQGIGLNAPTYSVQHEHILIARNYIKDCTNRGLTVTSASQTVDVTFEANDIDCDYYRQNANSNLAGTYTALSVPRGIDVGNLVGAKFVRNRFRNCCQAIASNFPAQNYYESNILSCQPVAAVLGFTNTNKGIGALEAADGRFVYEVIDADPTSATYGTNTNSQLLGSNGMPAAGYFVVGAYVKNTGAAAGVVGWRRLTNGNAHVLNTDWEPVYAAAQLPEAGKTLGYIAGAGGTVAQATDKTTGVTLNRPSGQITMQATSLAAATAVSFVLTNSTITADDVLILNHRSGGTIGAYTINAAVTAAGSATITIRNNTAGALAEALVLQFAVVQASNT